MGGEAALDMLDMLVMLVKKEYEEKQEGKREKNKKIFLQLNGRKLQKVKQKLERSSWGDYA